uniref:Uncharacterized protein LOC114336563 n=1 Tax=Diabrotica virgifera virgifera TaxID=50390 RepID=A0A6P7GCW9_DIAVI
MRGNRFFREFEALEADEVFQLIEEIPSGEESEASEIDSDDDGRGDEPSDDTNDESFVIEDDLQEIQNTGENKDTGTDIEIESSHQESSEDETRVNNRKRKRTKKIQDTNTKNKGKKKPKNEEKVVVWCDDSKKFGKSLSVFVSDVGPNVPEEIKEPLDVLCFFFQRNFWIH